MAKQRLRDVSLSFDTIGDQFMHRRNPAIADILRQLAADIEAKPYADLITGLIKDRAGNPLGSYRIAAR